MPVQDFEIATKQLKPFLCQYLQEHGIDPTKKMRCFNPDHEDKNPSANVVGRDTDCPRVFCHSCGGSFDIFDVAKILEKRPSVGQEWIQDTLKYLGNKYGVEIKTRALSENEIYEMDTYRAYRVAASLLKNKGLTREANPVFFKELDKRGWNEDVLAHEGVGTVNSFDEFHDALVAEGFSKKFLSEIDLNRRDIFNPDNMIFTWRDEKGRAIGFTARNLQYEIEKAKAEKEGEKYSGKKYNNQRTTGLKVNIFQKGRRLYGIDHAIKDSNSLYLFEGQADVITARAAGLTNAVAIAGTNLHEDHIQLLRQVSIYDVILCLDSDEPGQKKQAEILETKFAGKRDMRVRVVILPEGDDPDSYIRKNGLQAFRELAHWTAFEWRLNQYDEEAEESDICQQMIPFIVNESSPVVRDKLCKQLSKRTGVSLKAIVEELNILLDEKSHRRSQERKDLLDSAIFELKHKPSEAEAILQKAQSSLQDLVRKHDTDLLSSEDYVRSLDEQKASEEKLQLGSTGFKLGKDLADLEEMLRGDWEGCFICVGGRHNAGKSAFLSKVGYEIAANNPDAVVLYHTIDDTSEQLNPRFVCIAEGSRTLSINMVRQPKYWIDTVKIPGVLERREAGYSTVRNLAADGRLVVKDLVHGSSVAFIENLITYYQERFPDRRVIYILDNFHKLRDMEGPDERVRFKALSEAMKSIAIRRHCTVIATVEYTKMPPGTKPTDYNVAESVQLAYDANAIIHLYSDKSENPESFTVCHRDTDYKGQQVYLPRVEFIVSKNKISEQKGSFFLDFFPASSDYRYVSQEKVLEDSAGMKQGRKGEINDIPAEDMTDDQLKTFFDNQFNHVAPKKKAF